MITLLGYQIREQIYESANSLVYRGIRQSDDRPVILKLLKLDYPTPEELRRYKQEYDITRSLNLDGVVRVYGLEKYQNTLVMCLEDFGGKSISKLIESQKLALDEFLAIAIDIAETLGQIHATNIVHKDINPSNIVINPASFQVKIIDFGISTVLSRENPTFKNPAVLEGTLAYMSPEQTGRMNRSLDYRTDFYSLGATFYEMLAHQLPFQTTDVMELVHSHLALSPLPPDRLNPEIPACLANIIMKLLAKNAEDRYQSAWGLKADLEESLTQLRINGKISSFPLGSRDISEKFQIPQKLYGRQRELKILLAAFDRVASGQQNSFCFEDEEEFQKSKVKSQKSKVKSQKSKVKSHTSASELMLISGYSGVGKSALVQEIYKPITRQKGYFISGKFDQYQRNIPYYAAIEAFQELIKQLLTEDEDRLERWRNKILKALGNNGGVIIDVIPEVELLIGSQPPVPQLPAAEAQNRFNLMFQKFICVFTQREHPLVLFLDDLQWADSGSLKLIEVLMNASDNERHGKDSIGKEAIAEAGALQPSSIRSQDIGSHAPSLFLIGAYRDNEVSSAHPLMLTIEEIKKVGVRVNNISLAPLGLSCVTQAIADTLNCTNSRAMPLAKLVLAKTDGNPFFMNEFLKSLYAEGLLYFVLEKEATAKDAVNPRASSLLAGGLWEWDLDRIEARGFTDNVVELMAGKIKKLAEATQRALQLAACIGNQFDLKTLAIVYEQSLQKTALALRSAVAESLLLPLSDAYKSIELGIEITQTSIAPQSPSYKFVHDRIQQAAYALIPEADKQAVHLQVGQMLLQHTPLEKREEKIFDIVNQLNLGLGLIDASGEILCELTGAQSNNLAGLADDSVYLKQLNESLSRTQLARLNLVAARKAKASAAYKTAFNYLRLARVVLEKNSWQEQYEVTLAIHVEAAEAAYLNGKFEKMNSLATIVLERSQTLLDKVKVYETQIQASIARNKLREAIQTALFVLKMLGISFPAQPRQGNIALGFLRTKLEIGGKKIESLTELPEMTDPYKLTAMRFLANIFSASYQTTPALMPLLAFKQVNLSVQNGNSPLSAYGYANYGVILCGVIGDIEAGYRFGQLALDLLEKVGAQEIKARTIHVVNALIRHWQDPVKDTLRPLQQAYQMALENGDLEFAAFAAHQYCLHCLCIGSELEELEREMASYSKAIASIQQETVFIYNEIYRQAVLNLLGRSEKPCYLQGEAYDEEKTLPLHLEGNDRTAICVVYLCKLILGYLFEDFQEAIEWAAQAEGYLENVTSLLLVPVFYFYDSLARLARSPEASREEKSILAKVQANQKKMKVWSRHAPKNYLHKFVLVEAERHRVLGQSARAIDLYDRAIALAKDHEYINEEALANELAAKFYLQQGKVKIAGAYMLEARYCYRKWGATGKVKDLERRYSHLLPANPVPAIKDTKSGTIQTRMNSAEMLDLLAVMKASQAISSDIVLDKLLANLMKILIENAGAQFGYLILETKGKLLIEASGGFDSAGSESGAPSSKIRTIETAVLQSIPIDTALLPASIVNYVARTKETVVFNNASRELENPSSKVSTQDDPYIINNQPKSVLCYPLVNQGQLSGIVYLENNLAVGAFTSERLAMLNLLSAQAAISIENARFYANTAELNRAYERFVPRQFLQFLDKDSIVEVQLGDQVQQEMTVLFSDIREFTTLSESMTPEENFKFINAYLSRMEPIIIDHKGFIDKYIGDAIMALFCGEADDGVKAAIAMLQRLEKYNQQRDRQGYIPIQIGIGINTGSLMLGTVGGYNRMDGTVISDAVNVASRVEDLTKQYGASLLITHHTFARLQNPDNYCIRRLIDRVQVKGKSKMVSVFEIFDADPLPLKTGKLATLPIFEEALLSYYMQKFAAAAEGFEECLHQSPEDKVARIYLERSRSRS
ncbi:MAG: AAA family ATPase [Oscillatoria sp. SIO1A7]|nr:AAA family ATPase [Oscillatoria sp. SIO1A7]